MAKYCGHYGEVWINTKQMLEVTDFTYNESTTITETTAMGDTQATYHGCGIKRGDSTVTAWYDPSDTTGQQLIVSAGTQVTLQLRPSFDSGGFDSILSGLVYIESWSINAANEQMVTLNFSAKGVLAEQQF